MYLHVVRETDDGVVVSGAKMLATGSALTHATFVAQNSAVPLEAGKAEDYALVFIAPMDTPGSKLICRRVLRAERAQPVRSSALEPLRRERRGAHLRRGVHPVGELPRLSRRRARERASTPPRASSTATTLQAGTRLGGEARLHDGLLARGARGERHRRFPRRAGRARRGRRLAHADLGDDHRRWRLDPQPGPGGIGHPAARVRRATLRVFSSDGVAGGRRRSSRTCSAARRSSTPSGHRDL